MTKHIFKKEKEFVQIPNSILTNPNISLKAKGVLSLILSLPENWNFSIEGIVSKCKESRECVASAIKELESAGYIKREIVRGSDGKIIRMEYEVFEKPLVENQKEDNLSTEEPLTENPMTVLPDEENPWENNIKIKKKENNNIYKQTQSYPILFDQKISIKKVAIDNYREIIKNNIDYEVLVKNNVSYKKMIDEIIEIMAETICSSKEVLTVSGEQHAREYVKEKFLKINSGHMEYIVECLSKNTTKIGNIKQYIIATVYNASNTIDSYYTTLASHDLYG